MPQVAVTTTPAQLTAGPGTFLLRNDTSTASVFLEVTNKDGTVDAASGFEWKAGDAPLHADLGDEQHLLGVVAGGQPTQSVHVVHGLRFASSDAFLVGP